MLCRREIRWLVTHITIFPAITVHYTKVAASLVNTLVRITYYNFKYLQNQLRVPK